ncbi:hypothetical protein RQP46_005142 [Phenoliferia psychrophenolica]
MLGLEPFREDLTSTDDIVAVYKAAVAKLTAEELDTLANAKFKQAGTICYTVEESRETEQGRAIANCPIYELSPSPSNNTSTPCPWPSPTRGGSLPLEGIKVLELARIIAAPAIARGLAEMGATVIRITSPKLADMNALSPELNQGKLQAALDLKSEEGKARLRELILDCDVFIDGYRPGAIERLGFGREAVTALVKDRADGRGIVYVRENCYGWHGPWVGRSGWQQISDCFTGVSWGFGLSQGLKEPVVPIFPNSDYGTGVIGSIGVMHALHERASKGGRYYLDVSLSYYNLFLISLGQYPTAVFAAASAPFPTSRHFHDMVTMLGATIPRLGNLIPGTFSDPKVWQSVWAPSYDAGIVVEVFNEGLPRAAWNTIADNTKYSRANQLSLVTTLILVQSVLGLVLSLIFLGAAPTFVGNFVPGPVKQVSVQYVRIGAFGNCLASTLETAVSLGMRAMDHPDIPLIISTVKVLLQIFLDLALISNVHVRGVKPSIAIQATIRLVCDLTGAFVGLAYFLYMAHASLRWKPEARPQLTSLKILAVPGIPTFTEGAVRNAIYLYLVHNVVSMGQDYATAWGVFNTIRWGLIMVPVQALEATANAFVGHQWGAYLAERQDPDVDMRPGWGDVFFVMIPALKSTAIAVLVEVPLCLILSFAAARPFAKYLSDSDEVAMIVQRMWKSIDWCYIMYGVSTCLATVLLATKPRWYLGQSLIANLFYCLPWAIALSQVRIDEDSAWTYHALVFGGSLVATFVIILVFDAVWALRLKAGRL